MAQLKLVNNLYFCTKYGKRNKVVSLKKIFIIKVNGKERKQNHCLPIEQFEVTLVGVNIYYPNHLNHNEHQKVDC